MIFLAIAGVVSLLDGILFLFSPKTLQQLSNKVNTAVNKISFPLDEKAYKFRVGVGGSLILISAMLFYVIYYLSKKYAL